MRLIGRSLFTLRELIVKGELNMSEENDLEGTEQNGFNTEPASQTTPPPPMPNVPPVESPRVDPPAQVVEDEDDGPDPVMPVGEPNVRLAASKEDAALSKGLCNIGMESVMIPNKEAQLKGFYAENAATLVGQYPQYKFMQEKGQAHGQTVNLS